VIGVVTLIVGIIGGIRTAKGSDKKFIFIAVAILALILFLLARFLIQFNLLFHKFR
jgi:hypothetical protein